MINVEGGELRLLPVGDHDVSGSSPDPSTWIYRCSLHGPSGSTTRTVPSAGVVHVKYSTDPARPHRGVGPLKRAGLWMPTYCSVRIVNAARARKQVRAGLRM